MKLKKLITKLELVSFIGNNEAEIKDICSDSRKVGAANLFVAVKGFASDGHNFIKSAVEKGACAIVYEDKEKLKDVDVSGLTLIEVANSRHALAILASEFYDNPSNKLKLVGITGTNGKTTTATLLHQLFTNLGYHCGLLSTIANYVGKRKFETKNTTSDPLTINSLLKDMVDDGCEFCFMEVSSIGIEQERIEGLKFKVGIFSNLTHDHLDYHKTFAEYLRCKKLFFDKLPAEAFAITNIDDKNGMVMMQNTKAKVITYSCQTIADHSCKIIEESFDGMLIKLNGVEVWTRLIGQHNAYNLLALYATAIALGSKQEETLIGLSSLKSVPGRLENIQGPEDKSVIIDYAHTPDALKNVLITLREIAPERQLVCLFGCGGDRDKAKRPEMAEVAQEYSDRIIVTSDNSRSEKTSDIMADIKKGFDLSGRAKSLFIEDREEAIRTAIMISQEGATILLAGKGHETYQIIGNEIKDFDEKEIVGKIFNEMKN